MIFPPFLFWSKLVQMTYFKIFNLFLFGTLISSHPNSLKLCLPYKNSCRCPCLLFYAVCNSGLVCVKEILSLCDKVKARTEVVNRLSATVQTTK